MKRLLALLAFTACADDPEHLEEIEGKADASSSVEEWMAQYCPGIYTTGVQTYAGLGGTYARVGVTVATEPVRLTLLATRDDGDAQGTFAGTYTSETGFLAGYAGRFSAITDNPAIGAVLALDVGGDGEYDHTYFVLGLRRSFGRVRALCLAGAEQPFMMMRTLY